jgi:hypothetical protein
MSPRLRALLSKKLAVNDADILFKSRPQKSTSIHSVYRSTKTGKSEFAESSYELRRFRALDASPLVKYWTKSHGLKLRYRLYGKKRRYWPDILVFYHDGRVFLEEVKGHIFRQREFVKKKWAAQAYCGARRWRYRLIFEEDLERVD